MKENGTEKLIKLLDEYDSVQYHKINHKIENGSIYRNVGGTDGWHEVWRYCKQFGFIKWLVENDKIKLGAYDIEGYHFNIHTYLDLLMLLSISDTPIEDLISYLQE